MNYPLISEYIEAIKSAEDNFEELSYLRPVFGEDGLPIMTSGNFAVVFKMKDEREGKLYAVKCFTKEQEGRAEAYREITKELKEVSSPYLVSIQYLDEELFVDTDQTTETEFPVLLMDWVEGKTLDKYLRENLDDKYALEMLAYRFSQLAQWLIPQPFAHGDLKPDNILVREDGTLVLVDYDGMYVPVMKGQKARELGSPDFRHPLRTENDFDEHIDEFSLMSILLSLKAISIRPQLLEEYGSTDRLLLSERDYSDISSSKILKLLFPASDSELNVIFGLFIIAFERKRFDNILSRNFSLLRPIKDEITDVEVDALYEAWKEECAPYEIVKEWPYQMFAEMFDNIVMGYAYYSEREGVENACYFKRNDGKEIIVFNFQRLSIGQIYKYKNLLRVLLRASGHYVLSFIPNELIICDLNTNPDFHYYPDSWIDEYDVKYSADKKYLLEAPVEEHKKGTHTWRKGILNDSYIILADTIVICDKAFFDCRGLTSIKCPSSLRAIGSAAFQNCWSLKEVNLNYGLLEIGDDAFKDCKSLKYIHIPGSISYIASNAFEGSGISIIYTDYGDEKRVKTILPQYVDIIEELPF